MLTLCSPSKILCLCKYSVTQENLKHFWSQAFWIRNTQPIFHARKCRRPHSGVVDLGPCKWRMSQSALLFSVGVWEGRNKKMYLRVKNNSTNFPCILPIIRHDIAQNSILGSSWKPVFLSAPGGQAPWCSLTSASTHKPKLPVPCTKSMWPGMLLPSLCLTSWSYSLRINKPQKAVQLGLTRSWV
jgi:hypothetical protein